MDLSPDQLRVHDAVLDWLRNPREKLLTLGGAAGSGKSTLLGELSKHFPTPTAYVTPTGRAASVLARKLVESGTRITKLQRPPDGKKLSAKWRHLFDASLSESGGPPLCTTYHRLLLRPVVDSQTEELLGWQDRDDLDRRYKLIVVDECFHYQQRILTEDGWQTIGKIVENKLQCRVWSFNKKTRNLELKPIVRWIKNPAPENLLKIDASRTNSMRNARVIRCTQNHKILTPNGYVRAEELKVGDELVVRGRHLTPIQFSFLIGSMLGDGSMGRNPTRNSPQPTFMQGEDQRPWLEFKKRNVFGEDMTSPFQLGTSGYGDKDIWRFTLNVTDQTCRVAEQMPHGKRMPSGYRTWYPTDKFLGWVDEAALAVWYLDNGGTGFRGEGANRRVIGACLHTQRFDADTHEKFVSLLRSRFGVDASVSVDKSYLYLRFNRENAARLFDIIRPFVPACMAWKVPGGNFQPEFVPAAQTTVAPIRSIDAINGRSYGITGVYDIEVADNHNYIAGNIVVSNCSMVSDSMIAKIKARGVPVLAVGDHWQLPPVRDSGTLMKNPMLRLEQIHRQAEGSPIVALSRFVYEGGRIRDFKGWNADCVLRQKNEEETVVREMLTESRLGVVAIAWTNKTRVKFNRMAREIQGYSGVPVVGEPLVSLHNYGPICNGTRGLLAKESFLDERRDWILHANVEFPEDSMAGEWFEMNGHQFNRPHKFEKVEELRNYGIPAETIGEGGKLFDFSYCMTCHRAQGSQFDHVIVIYERDQPGNEEARRWSYTALTRASRRLTILV